MKCESCGNELIGAAIICRACNHNNALHRRVAARRAEPRHDQPTRPPDSGPPADFPTIVPRKDADVNLLHFPSALNRRPEATPARQTVAESDPKTETYPPWRAELKERVRRIKEKRATSKPAATQSPVQSPRAQDGEAKPNRNPIVESALNRIRWVSKETVRRGGGGGGGGGGVLGKGPHPPPPPPPPAPPPPPSLLPSLLPSLRLRRRLRFQPAKLQSAGRPPARRINVSRRGRLKSRKLSSRGDPRPSRRCFMRACWQASATSKSSSRRFCLFSALTRRRITRLRSATSRAS